MNDNPGPTAPAALPARAPGATGRAPANPFERLSDAQLITARDKLRKRLEHAATADQPKHANIAAAFGLFTAEVARRIAQARRTANRQGR